MARSKCLIISVKNVYFRKCHEKENIPKINNLNNFKTGINLNGIISEERWRQSLM